MDATRAILKVCGGALSMMKVQNLTCPSPDANGNDLGVKDNERTLLDRGELSTLQEDSLLQASNRPLRGFSRNGAAVTVLSMGAACGKTPLALPAVRPHAPRPRRFQPSACMCTAPPLASPGEVGAAGS
eukprot:6184265-Pleurochrysis_carterae.AAC.3